MAAATVYSYQQVILQPGECFNLPADAELIYASDIEALTSECDIPTSFDTQCYALAYENPVSPPTDDASFTAVIIDGITYPLSTAINYSYSNSANDLMAQMSLDIPVGIFIVGSTCDIGGDNQYLYFQSVGSDIKFQLTNPTGSDVVLQYFYLIPEVIDPCGCPS